MIHLVNYPFDMVIIIIWRVQYPYTYEQYKFTNTLTPPDLAFFHNLKTWGGGHIVPAVRFSRFKRGLES